MYLIRSCRSLLLAARHALRTQEKRPCLLVSLLLPHHPWQHFIGLRWQFWVRWESTWCWKFQNEALTCSQLRKTFILGYLCNLKIAINMTGKVLWFSSNSCIAALYKRWLLTEVFKFYTKFSVLMVCKDRFSIRVTDQIQF